MENKNGTDAKTRRILTEAENDMWLEAIFNGLKNAVKIDPVNVKPSNTGRNKNNEL